MIISLSLILIVVGTPIKREKILEEIYSIYNKNLKIKKTNIRMPILPLKSLLLVLYLEKRFYE
jgi:hypothetical protein